VNSLAELRRGIGERGPRDPTLSKKLRGPQTSIREGYSSDKKKKFPPKSGRRSERETGGKKPDEGAEPLGFFVV